MARALSPSEKIVIRELFKNPRATFEDIALILSAERERDEISDQRFQKEVDVRTISKFKSVGLRKIRQGLKELAETSRLDLSSQNEEEEARLEILQRNGILYGYDFRIDRKVYLFYSLAEGYILWQAHTCNIKCQSQCDEILNLIRTEHGLAHGLVLDNDTLTREKFEETFNEIVEREKQGREEK